MAQIFVNLQLKISLFKPREFDSIRNFQSSIHETTIMLGVFLRFCVFLLTLSVPIHQNVHVNGVHEKVYSSGCLFYFQCSIVNIFKYKGKYLLRRIPHASHGSFNPFVISNKQAHIINGNIPVYTKETDNVTAIREQPPTGTNDGRQHFMNYCLTHPEKFSCAVDCFLELNYAIFKDLIRHIERNEFFEILNEACFQLENSYASEIDMAAIREPVWAYLRQHCNSFATMSDHAVFSDIFTLNTVGVMTQELKRLFLIQQTDQSICTSCDSTIVKQRTIFVLYKSSVNMTQINFDNYISEAILPSTAALYCDLCLSHCGDISMLQHFVLLPTFLTLELSSNCIDRLIFPVTIDVLGQNYTLVGLVRCSSHHFTVAIKADSQWVYIDDMCVSVKTYTSFQDLLHNHSSGWFFAIFRKSSVRVGNDNIQTNFAASQTPTQNLNDVPVSTLPRDTPSIKNITSVTITKSSTVALYGICFSVLKPCVYWKSDASDAIVKCGSALFSETIKYQPNSSKLFQNINIYGAHIDVNCVSTTAGTLVRSSLYSKCTLRSSVLHNISISTGFLLHFSNLCLGCVFHKIKRGTRFFLLSLNEQDTLEIHQIDNVKCLVQTITNKVICDETEYVIQFILCSCKLTRTEKQKILRRQIYSEQKIAISRKRKKCYAELEPVKKKLRLDILNRYYNNKKQDILSNLAEKYKSMSASTKDSLLAKGRQAYQQMGSTKKEQMLARKRTERSNARQLNAIIHNDLNSCIASLKKKVREGPSYICTVCNRLLYRKTVTELKKGKYDIQHIFTGKRSFDNKEYICNTCSSKLLKGHIPCQAVHNKLLVDEIPSALKSLEKLEQILIAQRLLFQKIVIMPKGQQRKIKGAICNVPVDCDQTCNVLPRPPERSGIIMLKLKRKLSFRGHVYFKAVRPDIILNALNWLRDNNPFYSSITINIKNIDINLTQQQLRTCSEQDSEMCSSMGEGTPQHKGVDDDNEEVENPLNEFRAPTTETCLQSVLPDYPVTVNVQQNNHTKSHGNEILDIAPGQNKHPVSFMTDMHCEELAFPVLFPNGRFGYTAERSVNLSPSKYFNVRLLHHSGRFAMNPEYLFFAQFIIEQKKVSDSINIALSKIRGQSLTASDLRSNVQRLQNLVFQDQAYLFLRHVPGSPPYWQKFMYEVVAMVKQLGIPTWFMTLSCADLRWPELFQIIGRTQGLNLTDTQVDALSYNERCSMLNLNPVVVAKHFQYRVETFFTEVLLTQANPIGKIVHYALRIEFQMRGSPHLHGLIWTSDCPTLTHESKQDYADFIDGHLQAYLPHTQADPELYDLVATYQKHNHSKTCRKYHNVPCRFHFGQFVTRRTIVAEPLSEELDEEMKCNMLDERNKILTLVKEQIDKVLNPNNPQYDPNKTEKQFLSSLGITEEQYYWALSVSHDSDFDLHLKRPLDSCFINNYFVAGVKGFRANVDLQPVFNHYKCVTYVCSYFTKDETECSHAIVQAAKEATALNLPVRDSLRKIGAAFLSTREVSSQECVYRCMPELWLRNVFPKTVFVSTDLPEKRVRVTKSQQELDELDDDSTDIYKSNIIERYSIRPDSNTTIDNLCLAEFAAYYYKEYNTDPTKNDAQPEILTDDLTELHIQSTTNTDIISLLPPKIKLLNTNEVMKCRKTRAVIRYHTPNKTKDPDKYFHHLRMLYYPCRNEDTLLGNEQTYASKFYESEVHATVEQNRTRFEPDADAVSEALEALRNSEGNNLLHSFDSLNDQENEDLQLDMHSNSSCDQESFNKQEASHLSSTSNRQRAPILPTVAYHIQPTEISDDLLRESVRSLNVQQRAAYDLLLSWCRNKVKNIRSLTPNEINPIYLFVSGGGGSGKSHVTKLIYHTVVKTFKHVASNPELPTVLLMAPTGVSAINIEGTTINTALAIPKDAGENLPAMSDQKKTQMRLSLSELKLIIIDIVSMVSNRRVLHIHQRLKDIFCSSSSELFAGISVVVVGDFYQLPPIREKPIFENFKNNSYNLYHPWLVFRMVELTEIMRQKDDQHFIRLLNRLRTGSQTEQDINCINSRSISPLAEHYP